MITREGIFPRQFAGILINEAGRSAIGVPWQAGLSLESWVGASDCEVVSVAMAKVTMKSMLL